MYVPKTNIAPKKWCLGRQDFPFWGAIFRGKLVGFKGFLVIFSLKLIPNQRLNLKTSLVQRSLQLEIVGSCENGT